MDIKFSEGNRFLSDVSLELTSDVFTIYPNSLEFTRGDSEKSFKVGADKDLYLKGFPIFVIKTEPLG